MKKLKLNKNQKELRKRIIEISYKNKLSHIGSCLNTIDLIDGVYEIKSKKDKFVLSSGHAAVAWYVVLEKYLGKKIYDNIICFHPDKPTNNEISVSSGSLGQGLPIAVGMALSDRKRHIYCLISDGECSEGSIWESLRIIEDNMINNLIVIVSVNGYGAYDTISSKKLKRRLSGFGLHLVEINGHSPSEIKKALLTRSKRPLLVFANTTSEQLPFLVGQNAHYYSMDGNLDLAMEVFS